MISTKLFSAVKRWFMTGLLSILTISFVWQCGFAVNDTAMADSSMMLADLGDKVERKIDRDVENTKDFIDSTKGQVKQTANKNANKVDRTTDNDSTIENKAERDADRIENKANKDAARTKDALDETQNVFESTIDSIKDVFNN